LIDFFSQGYALSNDVLKNTLLTGRGYPPLLKNDEIPLLVWIDVSHAVSYRNRKLCLLKQIIKNETETCLIHSKLILLQIEALKFYVFYRFQQSNYFTKDSSQCEKDCAFGVFCKFSRGTANAKIEKSRNANKVGRLYFTFSRPLGIYLEQ